MKNRNGPARCCCGCTTTIAIRQGCSPFGAVASTAVAVHAAGGGTLLASGTTDAAGTFETGLPAGSYELRIKPGDAAEARRPIVLACGATTEVAYFSRRLRFQVFGCPGRPAVGAVVSIAGGPDLAVDLSGYADWYPQAAGAYSYTIADADDRYAPAAGGGTITNLCTISIGVTHTVSLGAAEGFDCCDAATRYDGVYFNKPRGPIKVATSAGDEWYLTSCGSNTCTTSDDVVIGTTCTNFDTSPPYTGRIPVRVVISRAAFTGVWTAAYNTGGGSACNIVSAGGVHNNWYLATYSDCSGIGVPGTGFPSVTGVINSVDPLSVTFTYDPTGRAWSWSGSPSKAIPHAIEWITLTEELP